MSVSGIGAKQYSKVKRRLQLKEERSRKDLQQEVLEGTSYKTSASSFTEPEVEAIDHIPEPLSSTLCDDVQVQQTDKFVVFDLETTGFGKYLICIRKHICLTIIQ